LHNFPAADADLQQSIKLDPNRVDSYYQLGLIFRERGDNAAAITQLEKAVAMNSQYAPAHAVLGTLYLSLQQYDKAQEHLMRAVALAPDTPDTHYQLGLLFARLNQRDRAEREMEQFRKLRDKGHSLSLSMRIESNIQSVATIIVPRIPIILLPSRGSKPPCAGEPSESGAIQALLAACGASGEQRSGRIRQAHDV
jgi:tetratricopeptide (TPR) repeat protein